MVRLTHIVSAIVVGGAVTPVQAQRSMSAPVQWLPLHNETTEFTGSQLVIGKEKSFGVWFRTLKAGQSVWAVQVYYYGTWGAAKGPLMHYPPNVKLYTTPSEQYPGHKVAFLHYPVGVMQPAGTTASVSAAASGPGFLIEPVPVHLLPDANRVASSFRTSPQPTSSGSPGAAYSAGMQYALLSAGQFVRLDGNRTLTATTAALVLRNATSVLDSWDLSAWVFLRPDMTLAVLAPIGIAG